MYVEQLSNLVRQGDLKITYILSPPRTLSTVLSIALAEDADGQIHEPLSFRRRDSFDEGCQLIVDRFNQLRADNNSGQQPIHLIVKDLTKYVRPEEWQEIMQLTQRFVFVIREPTRQMFSLIRRRVTEAVAGYRSANIPEEETFINIGKVPENMWIDSSWYNLDSFLDDVEKTKGLTDKTVIISGLSLRLDVGGTMQRMSEKFGWLPFNDKLTGGWTKAAGNKFYDPPFKNLVVEYDKQGINVSGWISPALHNPKFLPLSRNEDRTIRINRFPQQTQNHILGQIFPVYVRTLLHPLNISRPSFDQLNTITTAEGYTLRDINPVEAYVLLHSYQHLSDTDKQRQIELIHDIEKELEQDHPEILHRLQLLVKRYETKKD